MSVSGRRICRLAERAPGADSPTEALRFVRELRPEIDDFERQQVARALAAGRPSVLWPGRWACAASLRRFRDLMPARRPGAPGLRDVSR